MKLLALDQATNNTGYAIFNDEKLIKYGVISTKKPWDFLQKVSYIHDEIIKLIDEYEIDQIIFEDIQLEDKGNNVATFKKLAELYGILDYDFTIRKIPHDSVLAIQWRTELGIKNEERKQSKLNDLAYVAERFGLKDISDDTADAICIGCYYLEISRPNPNDWT